MNAQREKTVDYLREIVTYFNECKQNAHIGTIAYEQFYNWISALGHAIYVMMQEGDD